jgi:hypothetical protein
LLILVLNLLLLVVYLASLVQLVLSLSWLWMDGASSTMYFLLMASISKVKLVFPRLSKKLTSIWKNDAARYEEFDMRRKR